MTCVFALIRSPGKEVTGIKQILYYDWGRAPAHFSQTTISGLPMDLVSCLYLG